MHDRYHPAKRNPYNEIECSDHYARANANYSLFLAACGFSYNGPAEILGFAPKLVPENFKAPFTAAEGWGTFTQQGTLGKPWTACIRIAHGSLTLNEVHLPWLEQGAIVRMGDTILKATVESGTARFSDSLTLNAGGPALVMSAS